MSNKVHSALHADHRQWEEDVQMWRMDIEEWKKEQARLVHDLHAALSAETTRLTKHSQALEQHEERVERHEHLVAQAAQSASPRPTEIEARMADSHVKEDEKHDVLYRAHERIKHHHHRAMGRMAVALKVLTDDEFED